MRFDVLTLFPGMFDGPFNHSILKRARERGLIDIRVYNIRSFAGGKHLVTDDYPYGGGAGMVMKVEPLVAAVEAVLDGTELAEAAAFDLWHGAPGLPSELTEGMQDTPVILLSASGKTFNQTAALELAQHERLIFVCGHYEGVDERVRESVITHEFSIGDYVLTGGEPAAIVMIDAVARLCPGVLGAAESQLDESFSPQIGGLLEYPHYTRPPIWRGQEVPAILLSGHHAAIARWRREQALRRTLEKRPDLLEKAPLSPADRQILARLQQEQAASPESTERVQSPASRNHEEPITPDRSS